MAGGVEDSNVDSPAVEGELRTLGCAGARAAIRNLECAYRRVAWAVAVSGLVAGKQLDYRAGVERSLDCCITENYYTEMPVLVVDSASGLAQIVGGCTSDGSGIVAIHRSETDFDTQPAMNYMAIALETEEP